MQKNVLMHTILIFFIVGIVNSREISQKEQKIKQEIRNTTLPQLPGEEKKEDSQKSSVPAAMNVDSSNVIKAEKKNPNDGKPYFTLSTSMAPFQVSLGILKYFIPQWWGQLEINLTFLPSIPVPNYYGAGAYYKPYVAFRVLTGYSFYTYKRFEISLLGTMQFAFISSTDIPFVPTLGFRFIIDFFWIDLGLGYAVTISSQEQIFKGIYPAITVGFRF